MFNVYSRHTGAFLRTCTTIEALKFPESNCLLLRHVGGDLKVSELRVIK